MIVLENVCKNYTIKSGVIRRRVEVIPALSDITLKVKEKECIGLIGLNGAGKSTLLKIILGILKPDEGTTELFDRNAVKYREKNMKEIGVVFGQRTQLRWDVSPMDAYLLNKEIYNVVEVQFQEILAKYATILGVDEFWHRPVRTLSLGQKMRADLLASLLHQPKLLILDEPTIGVDVVSRRKIIDLITELKRDVTIIFTSHNLNDVYELCDRFVVLNKGEIVLDASKEQVSTQIGHVTVDVTIENNPIELGELHKYGYPLTNLNEFEYRLSDVPKVELTNCIQMLFSNNNVIHFSMKESDLESLLSSLEAGE